jgi:Cu/Ag efflux protein CusF
MRSSKFLLALAFLTGGCASYELQPLSANHPAHPEAAVTVERPRSTTLAYTKVDMPLVQTAAADGHDVHHGAPTAQQTVVGEGKIIATVPNANQIVVEHGEIKGFMEAMTMGYRVDPPSLMEGLQSGDKVRFTIDVPKKAIVKIEKIK